MRSLRRAARKVVVFPAAVRDFGDQSLAARRPAVEARHVGLGPGLVDEDQARRLDALLTFAPARPVAAYVRAVLLARDERLFLSVTPWRRKSGSSSRRQP
jgi:hypothetical protein